MTDEEIVTLVADLMSATKELIDRVSFDMNGIALPTAYAGGNGGLISDDTLKAADQCRLALSRLKAVMS